MHEGLPLVLVPSLGGSARLYAAQLPELWRAGPVQVADHTRADSIAAVAAQVLAAAPPRFALAGLSMGGYIAFEIMRTAPERVARLALLDTSARVDTDDEKADRVKQRGEAEHGGFEAIADRQFAHVVHRSHLGDAALRATFRAMLGDTGADAFARQQTASLGRIDSRPMLGTIRCPTLVLVGADDSITPLPHAHEMAASIAGAREVVVPECGHLSTIDQPAFVTKALLDWLHG